MSSFAIKALGAALAGAAIVSAHGHVLGINVAGTWYDGYDPQSAPYMSNPPTVAGWAASNLDNGFVAPDAYASGDIVCHRNATPAKGYARAKAGDSVALYWSAFPQSHHGSVMGYLARCANDDCVKVDKTSLEFFKIDEAGLLDGSTAPGKWGIDTLISNNNSWLLQIPTELAPGNYVLRHELLALHSAGSAGGAQNYPQCFNLAISGTGSLQPAGTRGEALYSATDPGILVDIYKSQSSYQVPGPAVIDGATNVTQTALAISGKAAAVVDVSTPNVVSGDSAKNPPPAVSKPETPTPSSAPTDTKPAPAATHKPSKKKCPKRKHSRDVLKEQ